MVSVEVSVRIVAGSAFYPIKRLDQRIQIEDICGVVAVGVSGAQESGKIGDAAGGSICRNRLRQIPAAFDPDREYPARNGGQVELTTGGNRSDSRELGAAGL